MSVSSILTSLENQVATVLGADYSELDYIYNLEDNNFKNNDKRYGIGSDTGSSVSGTNKAITKDFGFFVVLTRCFVNRSSDEKEREVLSEIYDQLELVDKAVFQKKLNDASVLLVSDIAYETPLKIDKGTIAVRVNFIIKYRNNNF